MTKLDKKFRILSKNETYLTIISSPYIKVTKLGKTKSHVQARCVCGTIKEYCLIHVETRLTKSCGCYNKEYRKIKKTVNTKDDAALYIVWSSMKKRCYNPNSSTYYNYGERGITVCKKWRESFISFKKWAIKNKWEKGLQVDRKNNKKGYTPFNCRIVTSKVNNNNRRNNHFVTYQGVTKTISEWAETKNLSPNLIADRIKLGWHLDNLFLPVVKNGTRVIDFKVSIINS